MVRPIITAVVALLILATPAGADLDLTPIDGYYVVEGGRAPDLNFNDSGKVISYSPPGKWKPGGAGKQMTLMPPDKVQASASIEALPAKQTLPATDENLKAYSDLAVGLLPRGASNVAVAGAAISAVQVCGYALAEVAITYKFFGQELETVIFFMPRPVEEIRFRLTCRAADFTDLYRPFQRSLFSLQGF
jgi:hypothetical protein